MSRIKHEVINVGPVRFPKPIVDEMDAIADRLGYTRSGLVRQATKEFIASKA